MSRRKCTAVLANFLRRTAQRPWVLNEGDVADKQVRVTVTVPDALQLENADGPTEHQQENGRVVFEPVEEIEAGEELEFTLTGTPESEGNVVLEVELESESLQTAVRAEEPTRLIKSQSSN